ncbi:MAG: imidazole glycerol phosphate synthase subunit HisH [Actinomycetota bacterium]
MLAVVDYGIGNLRSAQKAFEAIGEDAVLTSDHATILRADAVVLPGVGAFGRCVEALEVSGLRGVLSDVLEEQRPFLGICVGFQLLYEGSTESPGFAGLGVFQGTVSKLSGPVKVPQMQWNQLDRGTVGETTLLQGLDARPWVYFVHSFAPPVSAVTTATCDYGGAVTAMAGRGPVVGTQFHPEKSGPIGLAILENFVAAAKGQLPWS